MKTTVIYNGQKIKVDFTGEELKEMGFQVDKVWKPQEGENFYYSDSYNQIKGTLFGCTRIDNAFYDYGNCYKTPKEAEYERDCQLYLTKYKRWLEEHNEPIDWNNDQSKWYAVYRYKYDDIVILCECSYKRQGVLYATNYEIIEDFIEEIGEENFKKYILRVKEVQDENQRTC